MLHFLCLVFILDFRRLQFTKLACNIKIRVIVLRFSLFSVKWVIGQLVQRLWASKYLAYIRSQTQRDSICQLHMANFTPYRPSDWTRIRIRTVFMFEFISHLTPMDYKHHTKLEKTNKQKNRGVCVESNQTGSPDFSNFNDHKGKKNRALGKQ